MPQIVTPSRALQRPYRGGRASLDTLPSAASMRRPVLSSGFFVVFSTYFYVLGLRWWASVVTSSKNSVRPASIRTRG